MSDMPLKIWAYAHDCDRGRIYTEDEPVRSGFLEAPEPYINAEQLAEKIRGMKEPSTAVRLGDYTKGYGDGFNAAIDAILEKIEPND
jgi:hypothetical protein